ncbi:MAG: hypothetical protein QUS14_11300 [Pyrinomonadaceae bacterium]|nr:hypothetical protein [Pyrinomonadaceae bacterium]
MVDMTIKDLDARVVRVWEGLRPTTQKMLVGALESTGNLLTATTSQKFEYDAHSDWELSRLLTALDEQSRAKSDAVKTEARQLADTCASILESQSASAEVFIQLAARAIKQHDYNRLEKLADHLLERYSAGEIAEIVRQTEYPQIRAIAYETLALLSVSSLLPLLDDPLYEDIATSALEQKAFEYESEEARDILEQLDAEEGYERIKAEG